MVLTARTHALDTALLISLKNSYHFDSTNGSSRLTEFMRDVTSLGGPSILTIMTVLFAAFFFLSDKKAQALYLSLSVITGSIFNNILKHVFDIRRPDIIMHGTVVHSASFPSGHALTGAVTLLTLAILFAGMHSKLSMKIYIFSVAAILSLLIGASRLYLGVHWPSDVLAGWVAGIAWTSLTWLITNHIIGKKTYVRFQSVFA